MQKVNNTLIFLFLVSFCIVPGNAKSDTGGILLMEEDAAIGMTAGNLNKNFTLDRDAMNADEKSDAKKEEESSTAAADSRNSNLSEEEKKNRQEELDGQTADSKDSVTALSEAEKEVQKEAQREAEKEAQREAEKEAQREAEKEAQREAEAQKERDRKTPDPKNPNTTALINEWINLAKPPINATDCAKTRYEAWGRAVGRTRTTTLQASDKPDNAGGRSSPEYLWSIRDQLDSIDHCTLGEYVTAKLGNQSITHCKGRYKPKGPKANEILGEGRQYWNEGKLDQAINHISKAQKQICDDKKVDHALSAMKKQKDNIDKKLQKTSSYIQNNKLDNAETSLKRAAVISSKYDKYIEMKQRLEDARKKFQEEKKSAVIILLKNGMKYQKKLIVSVLY